VTGRGFPADVDELVRWAQGLDRYGLADFYARVGTGGGYPFLPNYPALLYLLWPLAAVLNPAALHVAVKGLAIPFDLAIGGLLYLLVRRYGGARAGLAAAALYLLDPAAIIAGPFWGQIDAVGTFLVLGALVALGVRRFALAGALAMLGLLVKPQFGIAGWVVLAVASAWLVRERRWRPFLSAAGGALAAYLVITMPLRLSPGQLWEITRGSAAVFPLTSLYAFNIWGVGVGFLRPDAPYLGIGVALFSVAAIAAILPLWKRRDTAAVLAAGALLALAFFFLLTRVHERYLFPALALLVPFAVLRRRILVPFLVLASGFTIDLLYTLWAQKTVAGLAVPGIVERTVFSAAGVFVVGAAMILAAAVIAWRLYRTDLSLAPSGEPRGAVWPWPRFLEAARASRAVRWIRRRIALRTALLVLLVAVPVVLNVVSLLPELTPAPFPNDNINHFLFVQRANEAITDGENPIDHWVAELELGFPAFYYYQHVPHLTIVALYRGLLGVVDLRFLYDLLRYLLLIALPFTTYWSMRQMRFGRVAAATGAAAVSLIATEPGFGFEYGSYIWRGYGLFTQLWGVHLTFVALAFVHRALHERRGYAAAILSFAVLALSHLVYAYMLVFTTGVVFLAGLRRGNVASRVAGLALIGAATALASAYVAIPFVQNQGYLLVSPYFPRFRFDGFGAGQVLGWLVSGELLDHGRPPVLTLLLAVGVVAALVTRTRLALLALTLLGLWLALYMGRVTLGPVADLLPFAQGGLPVHRFIGGIHLAAVLLIGIGGEWIWTLLRAERTPARAFAAGTLLIVLLLPAVIERREYYVQNGTWIQQANAAVVADTDARAILTAVKQLPPGRVYAGLHTTWADQLNFGLGFKGLDLFDLFTPSRIPFVGPPYWSWSLNSDLLWSFNEADQAQYDLFDVRYVIAPRTLAPQPFWQRRTEAGRYILYEVPTSGYATLGAIVEQRAAPSQHALFDLELAWLKSDAVAARRYIRYAYPGSGSGVPGSISPGCPTGRTEDRVVREDRIEVAASCDHATTLIFKTTYHPNWAVTIDGRPAPDFLVSPSYIGVALPPGTHVVAAQYRADAKKTPLLLLGLTGLTAAAVFRRRLDQLLWRIPVTEPRIAAERRWRWRIPRRGAPPPWHDR